MCPPPKPKRIQIFKDYKNENWLQFLFIVEAAVLNSKYQNFIRKFNAHKLVITFISVSGLS